MARSLKSRLRKILKHSIVLFTAIGCLLLGNSAIAALPPAQVHPLPPALAQWQNSSGDYFDQIQKTTPEFLIWSAFPVKVYIQPAESSRDRIWFNAAAQAVTEWNAYLPLQRVSQAEGADIVIDRSSIPIRFPPRERVRFADTRFELFTKAGTFSHRMRVRIRPNQPDLTLLAAARHELGHALGIWGHSPLETDALYFSQVRNPPPISPRDVNTLKRVYEQPTRLGWKVP